MASLTTYGDVLQHLQDYIGQTAPSPDQQRDCRRAALASYRELASAHNWTIYYAQGMVNTVGPYQTGTIRYQHSTGTYARQVTLSDGVWPSWTALGVLQIGSATYEVGSRVSDSVLLLSTNSNPGGDVDAGSAYVLFRDQYDLPCDFVAADAMHTPLNWGGIQYVHPRDWEASRTLTVTEAIPRLYTFMGSRRTFNTLCLALYPGPDGEYSIRFIYKRRPRPLAIDNYQDGTVSVSNNDVLVVGTGTTWTSKYVNCVMRFGADATDWPTGPAGSNLAALERSVVSVTDGTHLILDAPVDQALAGVKYTLSDPVDVEEGAMLNAYLRGCERQIAIVREKKIAPLADQIYRQALGEAMAGDVRTNVMRGVGWERRRGIQYKAMPLASDAS